MNYRSDESADIWMNGCIDWMMEKEQNGWDLYYLNIMFRPLQGSLPMLTSQMHDAVRLGFYARFCTEFTRNPRAQSQQHLLPQLWLIPDRPGFRKKTTTQTLPRNDNGLHFNGPMALPPKSRFCESVIQHIEKNQFRYARHGIERIHAEAIYDIAGIASYACKTIKWRRANPDDILILPASPSELPQNSPTFASCDRGIKGLQSAYNLSDELAREIYADRNVTAVKCAIA